MTNGIKAVAAAAVAAVGTYFKMLSVPFLVAVLAMLIDWLSGLAAAGVEGKISSRVGIIGIIKKVGYAFVIAVGVTVDWIIHYAGGRIGLDVEGFYYFGLLVTVWIIINELISILENAVRIGVPVPGFLEKIVHMLKIETEKQTGESDRGQED